MIHRQGTTSTFDAGTSDAGWKAMVVRGVAAIVFGVIALAIPSLGLTALLAVFAAYLVLDSIFVGSLAWRALRRHRRAWPYLLEAVADLGVAAAILLAPEAVVLWFIYLVAIWAIVTGLFAASPFFLPGRDTPGTMFLGLYAVFSVAWGCALFVFPSAGAVLLIWWLAAYALLIGVVLVAQGLRHRSEA